MILVGKAYTNDNNTYKLQIIVPYSYKENSHLLDFEVSLKNPILSYVETHL